MEYYLDGGYPLKSLRKHMLRAAKLTQDELLVVKSENSLDKPVVVTIFNPTNPDTKQFIHKNWNIIEHRIDCAHTFKDNPIVGFKKSPISAH